MGGEADTVPMCFQFLSERNERLNVSSRADDLDNDVEV